MQISLPQRQNIQNRRPWHGLAFIMESLVLLLFLIISVAIIMQVFSSSRAHGDAANNVSEAVILASNEAERFAANPAGSDVVAHYLLDDGVLVETSESGPDTYAVSRTVQAEPRPQGTLYLADIMVVHDGEILYSLSTSNYVSDGGGEANG